MRLWQFLITGGPQSGKSTCLSILEQELTKKGFKVFVIANLEEELLSCGIHPGEYSLEDYHLMLVGHLLNKEQLIYTAALQYGKGDVVILYDKGILDYKAVLNSGVFNRIARYYSLDEWKILGSYDAVFHLVTSANCTKNYYSLLNKIVSNKSSLDTALELDEKIQYSWLNHPNFIVIEAYPDFEEKVRTLLDEVFMAIDLPIQINKSVKFIVDIPSKNSLALSSNLAEFDISRTIIESEDSSMQQEVVSVVQNDVKNYYYQEKKIITGKHNLEHEKRLTYAEYLSLLKKGIHTITKKLYCFKENSQYFNLSIYPNVKSKAILEMNLTNSQQFGRIPDWINIIKELH